MKLLRFLFLIFRKGSLHHSPFDFEAERKKTLNRLPNQNQDPVPSFSTRMKLKLTKSKIGYSIISNLSYLRHARQMNVMLFVSAQKQLVYFRILKSGSTSILKKLLPTIDPTLEGHSFTDEQVDSLAFRYIKKELTAEEKSYSKFTLIRNPFHRIVSVYLDLFNVNSVPFTYESYWFGILKSSMTFSEFVNIIAQVPNSLKGPHFAPQHYILTNITKLNMISYFQIDKDQEKLKTYLSQYNINLPHQNKQQKQYDYRSFYNSEILNKVYKMYEQDVIMFDYKDEYNLLSEFVFNQENRMV